MDSSHQQAKSETKVNEPTTVEDNVKTQTALLKSLNIQNIPKQPCSNQFHRNINIAIAMNPSQKNNN